MPDVIRQDADVVEDCVSLATTDPSAVHTATELAACLQALRQRRQLSYAALDRSARRLPKRAGREQSLPRSTVSDALNAKTLPSREMLLTFLAACGLPQADVPQWLAAWERARTAEDSRPLGALRVRDYNPRHLGVHAAIQVEEAAQDLPTYVSRDIDPELHALLRIGVDHGCFVLLVGRSSVGKTRCAYQAALHVLPDWWLFHPADAEDVNAFAAAPTFRTVVWLDEVQNYLAGGLAAPTLQALLNAPASVVIIGTLWPDRYQKYIASPLQNGPDSYWRERQVMNLAQVLDISSQLSATELQRASLVGETDLCISVALSFEDYPMTVVLAAGPELVRRWENAPDPYTRAIITAAIDARRVGADPPLTPDLLKNAVPGYLTTTEQARASRSWLERAISYATETLHGAAAALAPVSGGMGIVAGYEVADYLLEYGTQIRRAIVPPASLWEACSTYIKDPQQLMTLAAAAHNRLLLQHAEELYWTAISVGAPDARNELATLLAEQSRRDEAFVLWREAAAAGDMSAWTNMGWRRRSREETESLFTAAQEAATAGHPYAAHWVADLHQEAGRIPEAEQVWKKAIAAGDLNARVGYADMLCDLGRSNDAEQMWRREIAAEVHNSRSGLAGLLKQLGRIDEAVTALQEGLAAGDDPYAWTLLAELLERQGHIDEAVEAWRNAATMDGDLNAWDRICRLLQDHNRADEAITLAASAAETESLAADALSDLLEQQERISEAITLWTNRVATGDDWARSKLAGLLLRHQRIEEGEEVLRDAVAAKDPFSWSNYAERLQQQGRIDDSIAAWWEAIYDETPNAAHRLATLLINHNRLEEAEQMWREEIAAGNKAARGFLAKLLRDYGHNNEATDLLQYGLHTDGSPAEPSVKKKPDRST